MNNSRLVYSTEQGRICPRCGQPAQKCKCGRRKKTISQKPTGDGVLRIRREVKGRKGKGVTTISGFDLDAGELKEMAARFKRLCGSGGSVKGGIVIIQGDHRNVLVDALARLGYKAKIAGG